MVDFGDCLAGICQPLTLANGLAYLFTQAAQLILGIPNGQGYATFYGGGDS